MKTRLLTLLVALFAIVNNAYSADEITSIKLTIRHNGGEAMTKTFPAKDFAEVELLEEKTTSLIIDKVEIETTGSVSDVAFTATMYTTGNGPAQDEWRNMPLVSKGNGNWALNFDEGVELIESDWNNKTKTFEFYAQAKNSAGSTILYNNDGNNYKITFTTGEGKESEWKVKFYKETTATLGLTVNGTGWNTSFNGSAVRETGYGWNPGEVSSFTIDEFSVTFIHNDGVSIESVSLQYKVYEEGSDGQWNGITGTLRSSRDIWNEEKQRTDHKMEFDASKLNKELTTGLTSGKSYVLELMYQVKTTDGDYFMFGKNCDDLKFRFTTTINSANVEAIHSSAVTSDPRFNFGGQHIDERSKGLMIINGKKTFVR